MFPKRPMIIHSKHFCIWSSAVTQLNILAIDEPGIRCKILTVQVKMKQNIAVSVVIARCPHICLIHIRFWNANHQLHAHVCSVPPESY